METAAKILITGGTLCLAVSFVIGFVWSRIRLKDPLRTVPYLELAHRVSLWEAFMLYGLVFAVTMSELSTGLETLAASLVAASAAFQISSAVTNFVQGVSDQFAQRSTGFYLATINSILATAGVAILLVGVVGAV